MTSPTSRAKQSLRIVVLTPALWPALEQLFGPNGACGGCWCMWWRIEKGERYEGKQRYRKDLGGPSRRRRRVER
jgi:hypothetical protein